MKKMEYFGINLSVCVYIYIYQIYVRKLQISHGRNQRRSIEKYFMFMNRKTKYFKMSSFPICFIDSMLFPQKSEQVTCGY